MRVGCSSSCCCPLTFCTTQESDYLRIKYAAECSWSSLSATPNKGRQGGVKTRGGGAEERNKLGEKEVGVGERELEQGGRWEKGSALNMLGGVGGS